MPDDDGARFDLVSTRLHTSVIGDVLDAHGLVHQFLPPDIRPLAAEYFVVGRAMPVQIVQVAGLRQRPFGLLTEALDDLRAGEVYIADNSGLPCAAWGEILTTTAQQRRAAGAVLDGFHRDTVGVRRSGFPVFSRGSYGQDAGVRASVSDFRTTIEIGGVKIDPGDLVVGDIDGVVVVPASMEQSVLEGALRKVSSENMVLSSIQNGMSSSEAFATYGVL